MVYADLMISIIKSAIILVFFLKLVDEKKKITLVGCLSLFVLTGVMMLTYNFGILWLQQITLMAVITLIGVVIFKAKPYISFSLAVTSLFMNLLSEIVIRSLLDMIMGDEFNIAYKINPINHFIIAFIMISVWGGAMYLIYKLLSQEDLKVFRSVWMHFAFIMTVFMFITTVFGSFYFVDGTENPNSFLFFVLSLSFLAMSILVVNFFAEICSSYKKENNMRALYSDFYAVKEQLAIQFQASNKMKKIRHDIKNHLYSVSSLLEKGEYEKAKEMLSEISISADKLQPSLHQTTGNGLVDAMISYKAAVCEGNNIFFEYSLETLPEMAIPSSAISSVLSNLLDNAIEASLSSDNPEVRIKVFMYKDYFTVIVKNTFSRVKRKDGALMTDKENKEFHGLGMEIVKEVCKENGGFYKWETVGNVFVANAIMKIN
ncbi:MAG: GHKL domain-containing protein [Ruminococcaceae bacterium]|nr:GHKL domain-containing protein [Oscillospiraceae bacterium]